MTFNKLYCVLGAIFVVCILPDSIFAACSAGYYGTSLITPDTNGSKVGYKALNGKSDFSSGNTEGLSNGDWGVRWSSGTVMGTAKGVSSCNSTQGQSNSTIGSSDSFSTTATGKYCWCKMTVWTPNGGSAQSLSGLWVFKGNYSNTSNCSNICAQRCTGDLSDSSTYRDAVFGAVSVCTKCPGEGTSIAGATAVVDCYIPTTTDLTNDMGTYHFSEPCYYSE